MSEQQVDWRTCPAGLVLDRIIAERSGWSDFNVHITFVEDTAEVGVDSRDRLFGRRTTQDYEETVPLWSTNTDAALELIYGYFWTMLGTPDKFTGSVLYQCRLDGHLGEFLSKDTHSTADTPALAVCRAFLAWKENTP